MCNHDNINKGDFELTFRTEKGKFYVIHYCEKHIEKRLRQIQTNFNDFIEKALRLESTKKEIKKELKSKTLEDFIEVDESR